MPDEAVELAYARRPHLEPPSSKLETLLGDRATVHYEPTLSGAGYRRVIDVTPAQSTKSMKAYEKEAKRAKKEAEERNKRERKEREEREKVWEKEMREWEKEEAKREKMREKEKKEEERLSERERRREEMLKSMTSVGMSVRPSSSLCPTPSPLPGHLTFVPDPHSLKDQSGSDEAMADSPKTAVPSALLLRFEAICAEGDREAVYVGDGSGDR